MALKCILFLIAIHSQIINYFGKSVFLEDRRFLIGAQVTYLR